MNKPNIEDIYALTPLQQGILLHTLDTALPGVYFDQFDCRLEATTDIEALRQAWRKTLARHSVLRTFFTWEKRDKPLQIVRHTVELPWQQLDWSDVAPDLQAGKLKSWLRADRERGFELEKAPLLRITIMRLPANAVRMILSFHHLILDGWSLRLLLSDVQTLYNSSVCGTQAELPPAGRFRAFVDWQLGRDTREEHAYWQDYLRDYSAPVFPAVARFNATEHAADGAGNTTAASAVTETLLDGATYTALQALARQQQVTLNTVFVCAWALLLSRYCDSRDVAFGTTVAGRTAPVGSIENTAGLFINTLPMRTRLAPADTVAELLHRVQIAQVTQRKYEHSSLVDVQKCSAVPGGTPLFETILVFENFPAANDAAAAEHPRALHFSDQQFTEYSNYPLALLVVPESDLKLIAVHQPARLEPRAVDQMLQHYTSVLQQMTADPAQRAESVSLLTDTEQLRMLRDWNATDRPLNTDETVITLLERCAANRPQAPALDAGSVRLNYAQLNQQANRLAWHLIHHEAASRGVVIYGERSADAIVAMFGALKAGAPYVHVDAKDSGGRLAFVLDDLAGSWCDAPAKHKPIVLTTAQLAADAHNDQLFTNATTFTFDEIPGDPRDDNPLLPISAQDVAYIIYTSGSTGRPKGIMVSHHNLHNSTDARFNYYPDPATSFALLSSLATDSAVAGIFWTLCSGGQLVIPASRAELDIGQLAELLKGQQVSHMLCVPSLYALILEHSEVDCLRSLNTVIVAGESCSTAVVRQHFATLPNTRLYNEYGPSEACVWASAHEFVTGDDRKTITIGRPIQNTRLYITDQSLQPVPVGVAGELCIGGANVALGYLGQQQLTAVTFLPDPFSGDATQRLYKTGDRARYLPDGRVEFLGRVDQQLKVRGYRVEPGEIEATITEFAGISEAVVMIDDTAMVNSELDALLSDMDEHTVDELLAAIASLDEQDTIARLMAR